jgi:hypothetical protein
MRFGDRSQLGNGEKMVVAGGAITSLNFEIIFWDDDVVAIRGARDLPAVEAVA